MGLRRLRSSFVNWKYRVIREIKTIWLHKYKVELGIDTKLSLRERIKYNLLGFTTEDFYNFNLRKNDYHNYISYRERLRLEDINGRFAYVLGEKLLFERIFGHYISVPHIHCWIKQGKCVDLEAGAETDIVTLLNQHGVFIAKPTRSVGGGSARVDR